MAIVSSYNDMPSAHQPYERFPALIKQALHEIGSVGQVAVVPAMCDGVTQGEAGMELAGQPRGDHQHACGAVPQHVRCRAAPGARQRPLPGLLIGALRFGHPPTRRAGRADAFGCPNKDKAALPALRRGQGQP